VTDYHFDERYQERVRLEDGAEVVIRLVGPEDKALIADGFEHMSALARYRRFFSTKRELSSQELRYFTEFDGKTHLALGATRLRADGSEQGVAVARFVRVTDDPEVAEAAVAVIDDFQNRGLGRLLLARLVAAARERGIHRFRATTLVENPAARALIAELGGEPQGTLADDTLSVELALPPAPADAPATAATMPRASALYRLFQAVAQGVTAIVELPHGEA
jgi:RimJ/RimL family protein N-acetyltransferase